MLSNVENSQLKREQRLICFPKVPRNGHDCAQCLHCLVVISSASLRPSNLINHRDKKHRQWKDDDIDTLSAKKVRYDLEATLSHLDLRWRKSLLFNAATRWHIKLRSVRRRILSLKNLSSHAQKKWLK